MVLHAKFQLCGSNGAAGYIERTHIGTVSFIIQSLLKNGSRHRQVEVLDKDEKLEHFGLTYFCQAIKTS